MAQRLPNPTRYRFDYPGHWARILGWMFSRRRGHVRYRWTCKALW